MPIFMVTMSSPDTRHSALPVYFLSDVHLGTGTAEEEATKQQRLIALLRRVLDERGTLFIVGDLFDFWYEYRHTLPRGYHRVLTAIEDLTRAGLEVTYFAGNHDFAIGSFFSDELGVRIVADDMTISLDGKSFYLYHGDGLAPKDTGYRMLKAILRNRFAQWLFRWIHPDVGFALAHGTSHGSRKYTQGKDYGPTDGMRLEAERQIQQGADYVIMGHRHRPMREYMHGGQYINLGDWIHNFTFAKYDNGELRMYTLKHDVFELVDL